MTDWRPRRVERHTTWRGGALRLDVGWQAVNGLRSPGVVHWGPFGRTRALIDYIRAGSG